MCPAAAKAPAAERPIMPAGYGISKKAKGKLDWSWVTDQLERSRNYWICTAASDGRPHAAPVWGLWLDGAVLWSTDSASRKARDLRANPAVVVHLESGDEAVMLEGTVEMAREPDLLQRFADRYDAKYQFRPDPSPEDGIYALWPKVVLAWTEKDFPNTATRFVLGGAGS
jgi:general stress protein 26